MCGPGPASSTLPGYSAAPALASRSSPRSAPSESIGPTASTKRTFLAAPPRAGNSTSNSATSSDANSFGDVYEACSRGVSGAGGCPAGGRPGTGRPRWSCPGPTADGCCGPPEGRVRVLAPDPAADARLRRGGVYLQQGSAGLPRRGAEAAAAARLGRPGVRPAADRPVAGGRAAETARPPGHAAAAAAADRLAPAESRAARAGVARADPGAGELDHPGAARRGELLVHLRRRRSGESHRRGRPGAGPHGQGAAAPPGGAVAGARPVKAAGERAITAQEIAALTGGRLTGPGTGDVRVVAVAPIDRAGPADLSFLASSKYLPHFRRSRAAPGLCKAEFAGTPAGPAGCNASPRTPPAPTGHRTGVVPPHVGRAR